MTPVVALVKVFTELAASVLTLSDVISPWLYATAIAGIATWAVTRVWGKPDRAAAKRKQSTETS